MFALNEIHFNNIYALLSPLSIHLIKYPANIPPNRGGFINIFTSIQNLHSCFRFKASVFLINLNFYIRIVVAWVGTFLKVQQLTKLFSDS